MMRNKRGSSPKAIYIHIPFCSKKCYYCDFTTYVPEQKEQIARYLDALIREMELTVEQTPPGVIDTFFLGGGTPTILSSSQMEYLLQNVKRCFPHWASDYEFTVEANPGTTNRKLLATMRQGGVNRISFGAQTFQPTLLREIGRIHSVEDIIDSVENARRVGFDNLSLDLMFGLPNQSVRDVETSLIQLRSLSPDHVSCYSLKVEEGTPFHALHLQNQLPLPTEEHEFEMYQLIRCYLREHGYSQYEISNFAPSGKESRHNLTYWHNNEYYGLGTGAHGYMRGKRHENVKDLGMYIKMIKMNQLPVKESFPISSVEDMENFMILGLRLMEGISKASFFSRYHCDVDEVFGTILNNLEEHGFIQRICSDRIVLTEKGLLFGNDVFASFLGADIH